MRKKILLFIMILLMPLGVKADTIKSINMVVNLSKDGTASITETWVAKADSGTEWYKAMYGLGNSKITNFKVSMDGKALTWKNWNVDEGLSAKAGYYGINNTSAGQELCFGKSDYKEHTFVLKYTVTNYIFNTEDAQVLYWTLMPEITVDKFNFDIIGYEKFKDSLDVWGFGYKGYAYVKDGKATWTNEDGLNKEYVVALIKFPLNTFDTSNSYSRYQTFDDVISTAQEGAYEYDYTDYGYTYKEPSFFEKIINAITKFIPILIVGAGIFGTVKAVQASKHGYINNKIIDKKNTPMFRDIPCKKDIYYANALIKLNEFNYKETNILGAIFLKWVRTDKIRFKNETKGLFNKETSEIDLTLNPTFDNEKEKKLFDYIYEASKDGILESKELEKWCRKNYEKFLNLFKSIESDEEQKLKEKGHIYTRTNKEECKYKNVMDDTIYNDSKELYGLKLFLEEFSRIDTKETMEVKIWDEYLMFAYLFGIADKVAKQLKNLYPEVLEQLDNNVDYNTLVFLNHLSTTSASAATSAARAAADSYSGGGGGFSMGGGGGGSFGGGGSAGGR